MGQDYFVMKTFFSSLTRSPRCQNMSPELQSCYILGIGLICVYGEVGVVIYVGVYTRLLPKTKETVFRSP